MAASPGELLWVLPEGMPGAVSPGYSSIPMERPSQSPQQSRGQQHWTQHPALWGLAVYVCLAGSSKASEMKEVDLEGKAKESQPPYHVLARNLLYPGSHTHRFPVPDEKVPWEVGAVTLGGGAGSRGHGADPNGGGKRNKPIITPVLHLGAPVLPSPGTGGFLEQQLQGVPREKER